MNLVNLGTVQNRPKATEPNLSKLIADTDPTALAIKKRGVPRATCNGQLQRGLWIGFHLASAGRVQSGLPLPSIAYHFLSLPHTLSHHFCEIKTTFYGNSGLRRCIVPQWIPPPQRNCAWQTGEGKHRGNEREITWNNVNKCTGISLETWFSAPIEPSGFLQSVILPTSIVGPKFKYAQRNGKRFAWYTDIQWHTY